MQSCLIADDHPLLRSALAAAVRQDWPAAAICEAADWPAAWAQAGGGHGLCLLDLEMPGAGPVEGVVEMRRRAPALPVLVVTARTEDSVMLGVLACGVRGFVSKTAPPEVVAAAIRLVLAGDRYLPARLAELVAVPAEPGAAPPWSPALRLTGRQKDVLRLLALGQGNKEIARALGVAPATVKTHVAHIADVLGAANRTDAARRAEALGLLR